MNIDIVAVGTRMPAWVNDAYEEYAQRLVHELKLNLVEIPIGQHGKKMDAVTAKRVEGEKMLAGISSANHVIALDVKGKSWSTKKLSDQLSHWMQDGRDVSLLVGGPDGLDDSCLSRADQHWSLSTLTFPHPLVRVILAEQLYRASSILKNHPYHRG